MQPNKNTKNFSELKTIVTDTENLTSSLTDAIDAFNLKKHLSLFDFLKSKGLAISSLLSILVMLPFYGVASIYASYKSGLKNKDFQGQKDAYYDTKNNEYINWRVLLVLHYKRFLYLVKHNINLTSQGITALIFDDTLLEKTGKKTEKVSVVNDHVTRRFILGFKLLVCGFWDGSSFIPIDFSLHREKGIKQEKLRDKYKKALKKVEKARALLEKAEKEALIKENAVIKAKQLLTDQPSKVNKTKLAKGESAIVKIQEDINKYKKELNKSQTELQQAKRNIKRYYAKDRLFGLTPKERNEQYRKAVSKDSHGNIRRRECDMDKISSMLLMLGRAVKNGIKADYVLTDSWFFCYELLDKVTNLKKGVMKLVSMVKINNQIFTNTKGKAMAVKKIPGLYRKQVTKCRKLKSQYIKVPCFYKGIRVNLFFIKMGKSTTWHLLLTTDLDLNFIKLMEVYQIRWSIEVFFKDSKQYLSLGDCKSTIFDAHIADITISMLQYILLTYFKRVNYMQSIGDLFKDISNELVEIDLISRLLDIFWELVQLLCSTAGIDFILFQEDILNNDEVLIKLVTLLPTKNLQEAA